MKHKIAVLPFIILFIMSFRIATAAEAPTVPTMTIDPSGLIKGIDEPFARFLQSINNVTINSNQESPRRYFDESNNWLKEKIGMGWTELGKMLGQILIFVLTAVKITIEVILGILRWLISLT